MIYPLIIERYVILFVIDPEKPLWRGIKKLIWFEIFDLDIDSILAERIEKNLIGFGCKIGGITALYT